MLQLNELVKLSKDRKRVGRGGSRGGTSGRGHKGQKARSGGNVPARFEGGQMPIHRRLPKRGFNNTLFKKVFTLLTLSQLDTIFEDGQEVTKALLVEKGVAKKDAKIKLLATGELSKKLQITVDACSESAKEAVTRAGGGVILI